MRLTSDIKRVFGFLFEPPAKTNVIDITISIVESRAEYWNEFASAHEISKRENFDFHAVEGVLERLVRLGKFERHIHRPKGKIFPVVMYRRYQSLLKYYRTPSFQIEEL